jgi:hypothetical protein
LSIPGNSFKTAQAAPAVDGSVDLNKARFTSNNPVQPGPPANLWGDNTTASFASKALSAACGCGGFMSVPNHSATITISTN